MATLEQRIAAGFDRLTTEIKNLRPRFLLSGGNTGDVLTKTSGIDFAVSWKAPGGPYGFSFSCGGKPGAGEVFGPWVSDRAWTLKNALAGCIVQSGAAFTAAAVYTLKRNGVAIGTATFAANGTLATLATGANADIAIARGDAFTVACPATADATGADIGFTFVGVR
jgi:hypothetical protein